MRIAGRQRHPGSKSIPQRLFFTLFFGIFAVVGVTLLLGMVLAAGETIATYQWKPTPCVIEAVENSAGGVEAAETSAVRYRYVYAGQEYVSLVLSLAVLGGDSEEDARWARRFSPGDQTIGYVDPDDPARAVLRRESLWTLLWVLFPLPFAAIGIGGLYFVWRRRKVPQTADGRLIEPAITSGARTGRTVNVTWFLVIFFGGFLTLGLLGAWFLGVEPARAALAVMNWPEVPCTIVSNDSEAADGDDEFTPAAVVEFRYEFEGRTYTGEHLAFPRMPGDEPVETEDVVQYEPGSATVCYVNPGDPAQAVLERSVPPDLAIGFAPLIFALVGAAGLIGVLVHRVRASARARGEMGMPRDRRTSWRKTRPAGAPSTTSAVGPGGAVVLEANASRVRKFIVFLIFALFWNGIVSVFVVTLIRGWLAGDADWFLGLFLLPFVGVGLLVLGLAGHAGLGMFNPRPRLFLSAAAVTPGGWLDVRWEMIGAARKLQRFQIFLEGREQATYRRGTDTRTDKSIFARLPLAEVRDPTGLAGGATRVQLPATTMHSFASKNNAIVWILRVRGEIPRWPDIDDEFNFTVLAVSAAAPVDAH